MIPSPSPPGSAEVRRLGVLGAGRAFEHLHRPALRGHPRWRVTRIHDPVPARIDLARRAFPEARGVDTVDEALDPEGVDAVLILTPPETHVSLTVQALERGLAVLVEKPLADRVAGARTVVAAARAAGRPVLVGFNRRYRAPYRALREAAREDPPRRLAYTLVADRRWSRAAGPGPLLSDLGSHGLDLVPWIAGQRLREVLTTGRGSYLVIRATLEESVPAVIRVGRGPRYVEWLSVETERGSRVAHPGGILPAWAAPGAARDPLAAAGAVADAVLARLRRRPGRTRESLIRQLHALAERMDGHEGGPAPGPEDGLEAVRAVEACRASLVGGVAVQVGEPRPDPTGAVNHDTEAT